MSNKNIDRNRFSEEKKIYFSQETEPFCGTPEHPETYIYRMKQSGVHVREHKIDTGRGGDAVEIVQITDVHFNAFDEIDEQNEELMLTKVGRLWLRNAESVAGIQRAMEYARYADQIVITGDTLDFLSHAAMELTRKYIWDVDPDALITLGGHDVTRSMQSVQPDQTSLASRQKILEDFWKHDIYYESRLVGDKALVVALDNGCGCYWDVQVPKLKADIERARQNGYAVLIFQHEPIATGRPEDDELPAIRVYDPETWDSSRAIGSPQRQSGAATNEVVRLIKENADVVRGIYCGHQHSAFYCEVLGSCPGADGGKRDAVIPQYILEGNPYDGQCGHVLKITVK